MGQYILYVYVLCLRVTRDAVLSDDGTRDGLDGRIIAGIIVGCIAGLVILLIIIFIIVLLAKKHKRRKQQAGQYKYP